MTKDTSSRVHAKGSDAPLSPGEQAAFAKYAALSAGPAQGGANPVELVSGDHRSGGKLLGTTAALAQAESHIELHNALRQGLEIGQTPQAIRPAPGTLKADS